MISDGVLLGLGAAVFWGFTDLLGAVTSRRVGTLRAATLSISMSLVVLVTLLVSTGTRLDVSPADVVRIGVFGALAAISTLALWNAFRHGPMTVVGPIAATVGATTVVFAWAILGEQPSVLQWLAVPAAAMGCILASTTSSGRGRFTLVGSGPPFALFAVAGFSIVAIGLRAPILEFGWLPTIVVARAVNTVVVWLVLAGAIARIARIASAVPDLAEPIPSGSSAPRTRSVSARGIVALILVSGVLDAAGFSTFAIGFEVAPVWLIGLLSSFGPAVGVVGGLILFGERPARRQWFGAAAIVIAVVGVAVG